MLSFLQELAFSTAYLSLYYLLFHFAAAIYKLCLRRSLDLNRRYSLKGVRVWACITGATSGLGLAFAHELAGRGFNILLVSRSELKLKNTQTQLKEKFKEINTSYIVADLGKDQSVEYYAGLV